MSQTLTNFDNMLKTTYGKTASDLLNQDALMYQLLKKQTEGYSGSGFVIPLHTGRNRSIGSTAEGGTLRTAGQQGYNKITVTPKYITGVLQVTQHAIDASKNDVGAFARAITSEMEGLTNDMKHHHNRMFMCDGSGLLATCASISTKTLTVDSTARLEPGMRVDIVKKSDGTTGNGVLATSIVSITSSTVCVLADATADTMSNTYGVYIQGSYGTEVMGLGGIVSDADPVTAGLHGLTVAAQPLWKAHVLGNSGTLRSISENLLDKMLDAPKVGKINKIITTKGCRRALAALLKADQQFLNPQNLHGGYQSIDFNGIPVIADDDCAANRFYGIDTARIKVYEAAPISWMDKDGAILNRNGFGYDAVMYTGIEVATDARNAHAVLTDITEA